MFLDIYFSFRLTMSDFRVLLCCLRCDSDAMCKYIQSTSTVHRIH